ncbi:unnamed protein product [marine sediment metagenome]|uniref:Uncharacterized protein n=1 Tax=marine sediment metagenome TaxID=412755 RepID=X1RDF5_9ZZZZ
MTPPASTPLQFNKADGYQSVPHLSELKTGLHKLAAKNALTLN